MIQKRGEIGVLEYVAMLPINSLNPGLILRLDAIRSAIRFSPACNDWLISKISKIEDTIIC